MKTTRDYNVIAETDGKTLIYFPKRIIAQQDFHGQTIEKGIVFSDYNCHSNTDIPRRDPFARQTDRGSTKLHETSLCSFIDCRDMTLVLIHYSRREWILHNLQLIFTSTDPYVITVLSFSVYTTFILMASRAMLLSQEHGEGIKRIKSSKGSCCSCYHDREIAVIKNHEKNVRSEYIADALQERQHIERAIKSLRVVMNSLTFFSWLQVTLTTQIVCFSGF